MDNSLYSTLGVSRDATTDEINKAFRKLVLVNHPDKGGDPEKFKQIKKAHEILSDENSRRNYDNFGITEDKPQQNLFNPFSFDMFNFDIFSNLQRNFKQTPSVEPTIQYLELSLEELYKGVNKRFRITKQRICRECDGSGAYSFMRCINCNGQGIQKIVRQLGPGMIQSIQRTCADCNGSGKKIDGICSLCEGKAFIPEVKMIEVNIPRGTIDGETFNQPDGIVIVVKEKPHPIFERKKLDLIYKKKITLYESLCGFSFTVRHLSGENLNIKSRESFVYKPNETLRIPMYGFKKGIDTVGDLFIILDVEFPEKINKMQSKLLSQALTNGNNQDNISYDDPTSIYV